MAPKSDEYTEVTSDDGSWDEVTAEQQIVLEAIGDSFDAVYNGMDQQENSGIWQAHFTLLPGREDAFINAGFDLRKKLGKVEKGATVRVIWESELDTGQKSPMRVFKVLQKRH